MEDNWIKGIAFENYRVFKTKSEFEVAPMTILTGANSSGKSSVIKALKLFQGFYSKNSFDLKFDESIEDSYHHQLGNFEMILNNESKNNDEIIITYKLKLRHYWDNLAVEYVFCMDETSKLKNGKLKTISVYTENDGDTVLLSKITNEGDFRKRYFNIPAVIQKFRSLADEFLEYKKKFECYKVKINNSNSEQIPIKSGDVVTIKDYTGPVKYWYEYEQLEGYHPEVNESFCDFLGVDYEKFQFFDENSGITCFGYDSNFIRLDSVSITNESPIASPNILRRIAKIPLNHYDHFELSLWYLVTEDDPNIEKVYTFESFLKLFEEVDSKASSTVSDGFEVYDQIDYSIEGKPASLQLIKEFIKKNKPESFDAFYNDIIKEIYKETSNYDVEGQKLILQVRKDYSHDSGNGSEKYPNTNNLIAILYYFYMIEFYLKRPNAPRSNVNGTRDDWKATIGHSKLYEFLENAEDDLDKVTSGLIESFYKKCDFIESVRANSQRLYTFATQGTSFNRYLLKLLDRNFSDKQIGFLTKWVREFEIGDSVDYQSHLIAGVGTQIYIIKGKNRINIADMGYGATQLIALLLRIMDACSDGCTTITVEEPETNLHPKFQSKLADLFIDVYKVFGVQFIIETHSEYLVRKLQYLTAKDVIKPNETVLHYLGHPEDNKRASNEEQIRTIHIKKNGQLTKPFGSGFTDESMHWIKEMFGYFNQQ